MASTSETGHAKNVANFDDLISFVIGYGTDYNPSKAAIKLAALQSLSAKAKTAISEVHAAQSVNSNAKAAREAAFEPLKRLVTRVMSALKATDTTSQVDDSARTLVRKIRGTRAKHKKAKDEKTAPAPEGKEVREGKEVKEISVSQLSYDNRLDNFDKLVKLLDSIDLYAPNEADLSVPALEALFADLTAKNTAVVEAATHLSNSRIARDAVLYKPDTGMVDISLAVKNYVKSLYGGTNPHYKQVSKLRIKKVLQ